MSEFPVEQANYSRHGVADPQQLASSSDFSESWHPEVQRILLAFGEPPIGVPCPSAVFAQPLGHRHVIVVEVNDLGESSGERLVGFHVLVLPHKMYTQFFHNPFDIAKRFPPDWQARGDLPALHLPQETLPVRTVDQIRKILQRVRGQPLSEEALGEEQVREITPDEAESPALLGGAQVLVDGGKLVFHRSQPDTDLLEALWALLPNSVRGELWPASFAFGNELSFDVLVVPRFNAGDYIGYTTEELAADYPDGKYEYSLQRAAEHGDQEELNALFERRSLKQTWRMGLTLLVVVSIIVAFTQIRPSPPPPPPDPIEPLIQKQAAIVAGVVAMQPPYNTGTLAPAAQDAFNKINRQIDELRAQ